MNFIFKCFSTNSNVKGYEVHNLPIVLISAALQKPIIAHVAKILAITAKNDLKSAANQDKLKNHECQIDQLVYQLYCLTPEEITVVEGKEV